MTRQHKYSRGDIVFITKARRLGVDHSDMVDIMTVASIEAKSGLYGISYWFTIDSKVWWAHEDDLVPVFLK